MILEKLITNKISMVVKGANSGFHATSKLVNFQEKKPRLNNLKDWAIYITCNLTFEFEQAVDIIKYFLMKIEYGVSNFQIDKN